MANSPAAPDSAGAAADCSLCDQELQTVESFLKDLVEEVAVRMCLVSGDEVAAMTLPLSCTVVELEIIAKRHIPEGARPRLLLGDQVLKGGSQTLADVGLTMDSTLTLLAHRAHFWAGSTSNPRGELSVDENDTYIFSEGQGGDYWSSPVIISAKPSTCYRVRIIEHDEGLIGAMHVGFVAAAPEERDMARVGALSGHQWGGLWSVGSRVYRGICAGQQDASDECIKVMPEGPWGHQLRSGCIVEIQLYSDEGKCFFKASVDNVVQYLVEVEQAPEGDVYPAVSVCGGTRKVELMDIVDDV